MTIKSEKQKSGDLKGLRTHHRSICKGEFCCIHNPSNHHMRAWPRNWRSDIGVMERICPHGIGHPDPDHLDYTQRKDPKRMWLDSVHGCDGCCRPPKKAA